ncbi:uncharacterized protein LOC144159087 isoform X5 [Haemaphysalis longicornis]
MTAFEEMGVLPEIAQAVEDMEWTLPTDVQAEAVPLILGGGDVLMRLIDVAIKEVMLLEACQLTGIGTTNVNRTNFKMADGQGRNTSVGYIILDLQFI